MKDKETLTVCMESLF